MADRATPPQNGTVGNFFHRVETRQLLPWPPRRADLHWHLLFDPDLIDQALVTPYRALTHRPGLAPVPARWIHLTVLHAGPVADYRPGELDAIVQRVADQCIEPFDILVDRPTIGTVAIECPARPGAPVRRLWETTAAVDAEVTNGRFPRLLDHYYPHISLAYGTPGPDGAADRAALKAIVADLPGEPIRLRADQLVLVAQHHDRRHITWTPLATVYLRQQTSTSTSALAERTA